MDTKATPEELRKAYADALKAGSRLLDEASKKFEYAGRMLASAEYAERAERGPLNLDPKPWAWALSSDPDNPLRESIQETGMFVFMPRPEYNQNREDY